MLQEELKYQRILVKVSGEALGGTQGQGFDMQAIDEIALQIESAHSEGAAVAVVVGGGNIARGEQLSRLGMDRVQADYVGMLATIQNGLALQSRLEARGKLVRVMSALAVPPACEAYIVRRALRHLEKGRIVICVGGTGNPLCTTDTASAQRAIELKVDAVLACKRGTRGVYDRDPNGDDGHDATFLPELTYDTAIRSNLRVMDQGAMVLLRDHRVRTLVFDLTVPRVIQRVLSGERIGSVISP